MLYTHLLISCLYAEDQVYTHLQTDLSFLLCGLRTAEACLGRSHALADRFVIFELRTMIVGCLFLAPRIMCWRRILRGKGRACKRTECGKLIKGLCSASTALHLPRSYCRAHVQFRTFVRFLLYFIGIS